MTDLASADRILWQPAPALQKESPMALYMAAVNRRFGKSFANYADLYAWSIKKQSDFWGSLADFCQIKWIEPPKTIYTPPPAGKMRGALWFQGAKLNFAENLLPAPSQRIVLSAFAEGCPTRHLT